MKSKLKVSVVAAVATVSLTACGSSAPSDVSQLRQACKLPPSPSSSYDYAYETVSLNGQVTGIAQCGTDGSVTSWAPRPSGSGDSVRPYDLGQQPLTTP